MGHGDWESDDQAQETSGQSIRPQFSFPLIMSADKWVRKYVDGFNDSKKVRASTSVAKLHPPFRPPPTLNLFGGLYLSITQRSVLSTKTLGSVEITI
jgi:hypothetical protein